MLVGGVPRRTIWLGADGWSVGVIDQTKLIANLVKAIKEEAA